MADHRSMPIIRQFGGAPPSPEHQQAAESAAVDMLHRLNDAPAAARFDVVCSFLLSVCVNHPDPVGLHMAIARQVAPSIQAFLDQPAGHG